MHGCTLHPEDAPHKSDVMNDDVGGRRTLVLSVQRRRARDKDAGWGFRALFLPSLRFLPLPGQYMYVRSTVQNADRTGPTKSTC